MKLLRILPLAAFLVLLLLVVLWKGFTYIVTPDQQVIITKFGEPIGEPKTEPGLYWKLPFVHTPNEIDKRILEWDGPVVPMSTKEKTLIYVDTFGRWRIEDPLKFLQNFREERRAQSRIDDILRSATQSTIASHRLVEVVRTEKDRVAEKPSEDEEELAVASQLGSIRFGRTVLEKTIFELAEPKLRDLGLELLDIRFKRINYNANVEERIFAGMKAERAQIASRFRSEGEGQAAEISGTVEKEIKEISSGAYRQVEEIKGKADAEATGIYAAAYNRSPEAVEFYEFLRTMEVYKNVLSKDTTLVLSTDSDLFKMLKGIESPTSKPSSSPTAPAPRPAPQPQRIPRLKPLAE